MKRLGDEEINERDYVMSTLMTRLMKRLGDEKTDEETE